MAVSGFLKELTNGGPLWKKKPTFFMEKQQDLSPPVAASVLRILPNFLQFLLGLYHNRDCDYTDNLLYFFWKKKWRKMKSVFNKLFARTILFIKVK